jgi:CRISPR/Cas system-associated exonuclease Cas4 (RecB family)
MLDWDKIVEAAIPYEEQYTQPGSYASKIWITVACLRRSYYDRVDPIKETNVERKKWFVTQQHGIIVGQMVVDFFKRAGMWLGDEVRGGAKDYNLTYRSDMIVNDDGVAVPVEVKSVKAKKWGDLMDDGWKGDYAHLLQIQCYIHFHQPEPYPYGYLLYFNRNTDEVKLIVVEHDEDMAEFIEKELESLEMYVEAGEEPSIDDVDVYDCKYCPYRKRCGK